MIKKKRVTFYVLLLILSVSGWLHALDMGMTPGGVPETKEAHDARMAWWRNAKFGMFIHWGLYSIPAGVWKGKTGPGGFGEWIMHDAQIPIPEYAALAQQFNPIKFDANAWVGMAKQAGVQYIVITAKHHDGFAMFHSKVDSYNIYDATPFHRDPIAELAVACKKQGLRLGIYYSQAQDWHHPGGASGKDLHWDPGQLGDMKTYINTVAVPQVKELLTHYGPICEFWWDTPYHMDSELADPLAAELEIQPAILSNNRLGEGHPGDFKTPEGFIPPQGYPGEDWETCMTLNGTWGYKASATKFRTPENLIQNLIDIVSKGGNYLLNVGPDSQGIIPQPEVDDMLAVGAWLKINDEAISGTRGSPFPRKLPWGRVTQKPGKLFLSVFKWPAGGMLLLPVRNTVSKAYLLASNQALSTSQSADGTTIQLPATAPDPIATVVVAEVDNPVDPLPPKPIAARPDGVIELYPADADLLSTRDGGGVSELQVGGTDEKPELTNWASADDYIQWKMLVVKPGSYEASLDYAVRPDLAGSKVVLAVADQTITGTLPATKSDHDFQKLSLGTIRVATAGPMTVTLRATLAKKEIAQVREITFTPLPSIQQ